MAATYFFFKNLYKFLNLWYNYHDFVIISTKQDVRCQNIEEDVDMISKAFQNIVSQMAEVFPKRFGIADEQGMVLAANGSEIPEETAEELVYAASRDE